MRLQNKRQSQLAYHLQQYYTEEIHRLLNSCSRDKAWFSILIGLKYLLVFLFSISSHLKELVDADSNFIFLKTYGVIDYMDREQFMDAILYFFLAINAFILLFICVTFCIYISQSSEQQNKVSKSRHKLNVNYDIEEGNNDRRNFIRRAFSLIVTIYRYLVYVPTIFFSLYSVDKPIAVVNVSVAILLNLVLSDNDYNYEILKVDYLAKPFSYSQFTFNAIVEISLFFAIALVPNGKSAIVSVYYLVSGIVSCLSAQYFNELSQFINILAHICFFCSSVVTEIGISFEVPNQLISYFFIIYLPLCYKLTGYIVEKDKQQTLQEFQNMIGEKQSTSVNLDKVMRLNLFGEIVNSRANELRDVRLLNLIINSNINFSNSSFKAQQQQVGDSKQKLMKKKELHQESNLIKKQKGDKSTSQQNVDDVTGLIIIRQRIKQILKEQFKKNIKEKKRNKEGGIYEILIFFVYLIEIAESPRIYWMQYLELIQNKRLSIKQLQLFSSVHSIFLKKRSTLRKIMGRTNPFDCSYLEVIVFEKRLEQSYQLFDSTIKIKLEILNVMKQKEIVVTELTSKIEKMQKEMRELRIILNSLSLMNDDSVDLLNIQALYLENLAFNEKDINLMQINKYRRKHQSRLRHRYLNHANDDDIVSSSINNDRFDEKTCIVFATYKDSRNLIINQVSQNFQDIFYFTTNNDIIGHNIEAIIPFTFQPLHCKYLESYLEEEISAYSTEIMLQNNSDNRDDNADDDLFNQIGFDKNKNNQFDKGESLSNYNGVSNEALSIYQRGCRMNQQIIFAQISPLFILPVRIDIRTNKLQDNDSFGLTAKIRHINDQFEYILFDERNLNVIGLTEKLHFNIFPHYESLSKINIRKVLPFLQGTIEIESSKHNNKEPDDRPKQYHVNLTHEMEDILREQRLKRNNQSKRRKILFIIIQQEDMKNTISTAASLSTMNRKSTQVKSKSFKPLKSTYIKNDLSSYNFTFIEFTLHQVKYRGIENMSYMEISKIRPLNPNEQASFILSQLKNSSKQQIYEQLFPVQSDLDRIISELEQKVIIYHQQHQIHPSQLSSSLQAISALNNYLFPQNLSNNQISTAGSSLNNLMPLQQQNSCQLIQQGQQQFIMVNDDSSNLEQVKVKSSNNNVEEIVEQEEDDGSVAGNNGYVDTSIDKKQKNKEKSQQMRQGQQHPHGNYRQNSIENHNSILQQNSLVSQDQKLLHSIQELQYVQEDPTFVETTNLNGLTFLQNYNYNNNVNVNANTTNNYNQTNLVEQSANNQEVSLINFSQTNIQHNNLEEDRFNASNAYENPTFNDISRIGLKKQIKQQQILVSPTSSDQIINLVFNSPTGSQGNILSNINNPESKNQLYSTATASYQDLKFFSPRVTQQSASNLIEVQQINSGRGKQQNNNRFFQKPAFDTLLSPAASEGERVKLDLDTKLSPNTAKLSAKDPTHNMNYHDKNNVNIQVFNPNYESQLAPRLRESHAKNGFRRDEEYYSTSSPFGYNPYILKEDKATKKQKVQDIQYEIASTNSKDSSCASAKRQLQQIMADKSTLQIIKAINIIGILCFATMVCITWVQFVQMTDKITGTYKDYQVFDWPTKYQSCLSQIFKSQNILYLTQYSTDLQFKSTTEKDAFRNKTRLDMVYNKDIVRTMIAQMERASTDRKIFSLLRDHYFVFQIGQQYDLSIIGSTPSIPSKLVAVQWNTTIQSAIILAFQHVYRYSADVGKGRPEYYMIANQLLQISNLKDVQSEMLVLQQEQELQIQDQLTSLMILIIIINGTCIGIIIPLYYHIQKERDVIIQLFATFSTQKIDNLIKSIQKSYYNQKSLSIYSNKNSQQLKQTMMSLQKTEKEKDVRKQNISTITKLPRFNSRINIVVLFIYILIICYPIINKVITQEYLQKSTLDLETLIEVYQLRSYMLENVGMHFNALVMKVNPTLKPQSVTIYYDYMKDLIDRSQEINDKIQWTVNEQYESSRYAQSLYDSFFFSAFKDNLCDTFGKYPQFNTNSTKINTQICASTYQGFLMKGLQVAYKQLLTIFPELYNMYIIPDTAQSLARIKTFLSTFDIQDFILYQEFIDETIISLKEFILQQNKEYYDYIMLFQIVLIIYQMILMILVFAFGWLAFSNYLNNSLHQTKTYLQIIDINSLIENSYILTYIKKNQVI